MPHWFKLEKNHIWTPAGIVEGTLWTPQMRKQGYETLMKAKEIELEIYKKMSELLTIA